jgi:hypothetical protein
MKNLIYLILLPVAWCIAASCSSEQPEEVKAEVTDTIPSLVMQIQKTSRLYTTEYQIHKIVTHDDVVRLKGNFLSKDFDVALPLGERKIAIPMNATLKAYIDFSDFSEKNIERHGENITILLPDPKITLTSSKINQKEIKEYVGLTRSHFSDKELTNYEQQGRKAILNNIPNMGLMQAAQENAARVLVPMITQMGYQEEHITIAFRKNLSIQQLINSTIEKQ